jgi:hypothetical protein
MLLVHELTQMRGSFAEARLEESCSPEFPELQRHLELRPQVAQSGIALARVRFRTDFAPLRAPTGTSLYAEQGRANTLVTSGEVGHEVCAVR